MAHVSQEYINRLYAEFGQPSVVDDIVRLRGKDTVQTSILAYPRREDSPVDYEFFTGDDLDRFVDNAVYALLDCGFTADDNNASIALMAPSNLEYVVMMFALMRMGYGVLSLSLRLSSVAMLSLMQAADCETIIYGHSAQTSATVATVQQQLTGIRVVDILHRVDWDKPKPIPFHRRLDASVAALQTALILHSSGSTGLPKHRRISHAAMLTHLPHGRGVESFNVLPWYHMYGLSTSFSAMWRRKTAYLINASLPLTSANLTTALRHLKPEAVFAVPYALKLIAETADGVDLLRSCASVTGAGARVPDELGDRLIRQGVTIGLAFGATEAGMLGDSIQRDQGDDSWSYIRLYANVKPHVRMDPISSGLYELIYLKTHPALSATDPDGSYRSRDVFTPHPTIPDAWKYVTRIDDRITLLNGEKVLPLPIEGRVREHPLVNEAVVVGIDRAVPGLLVFCKPEADGLPHQQLIDLIWPAVKDANSRAEAFSQITRDMIRIVPSKAEYARTDKANIMRSKVYLQHSDLIDNMYDEQTSGGLKLELAGTVQWLLKMMDEEIGVRMDPETDFFQAGVDSLLATHARRIISRHLHLEGHRLGSNVLYDCGNILRLAEHLCMLSEGRSTVPIGEIEQIPELIEKFSTPRIPGVGVRRAEAQKQVVILTGATGSIGAHVLAELAGGKVIDTIYCFVRGSTDPMQRILSSLQQRALPVDLGTACKVVALQADLDAANFGLDAATYQHLLVSTTTIIHAAWPVNFALPLQSFEPHLRGLQNLVRFSLSVSMAPARLLFCSSVSTAAASPRPGVVPEEAVQDPAYASAMGYARSKLVAEHILLRANKECCALAQVLRIGQVAGDSEHGIWNDSEAVPLLVRSALAIGALPLLTERPAWLPVDLLARVVADLVEQSDESLQTRPVLNLVNPNRFDWATLLAELKSAGLQFETVGFPEWLERMVASEQRGEVQSNPGVKLLDYYRSLDVYVSDYSAQSSGSAIGGNGENAGRGELTFATDKAQEVSDALRCAPRIVEGDYVARFVKLWVRKWEDQPTQTPPAVAQA